MGVLNALLNTNRRRGADARQFGSLLALMFLWMLALPVAGQFGASGRILSAAFAVVAVQALLITARSRRERWMLVGWGVLIVVHPFLAAIPQLELAAAVALGLVLLYIPVRLSAFVLEQETVDSETVFGALCAYLFMGLCWAVIYATVVELRPDAIFVPEGGSGDFLTWVYFSFTTLTTLGYGDVAPRLDSVRMLAILEALIGQIYLVVIVARLVGSYMGRAKRPS